MATTPPKPDYADDFCWVNRPGSSAKAVDVFYVHPTIYAGKSPDNMDIAVPGLRAFAKGLLTAQAGVYAETCNLFAPFYRQQSGAVQDAFTAAHGTDMFADPSFQLGAGDVEAAFDHYLAQLNPDRPFILAGHSQGTMTLIDLMRKRFADPGLQKRMVAAYLIGYSVTAGDYEAHPWMRPARGEADTGVVISYNTESPDAQGSPVLLPGAVAINPVNWRTDEVPAGRDEHAGAVFFNDVTGEVIEEVPNFAEARVDKGKGVLVATGMRQPQSEKIDLKNMGRFPAGVYHKFDYAFWYENLKENVAKRVAAYLG